METGWISCDRVVVGSRTFRWLRAGLPGGLPFFQPFFVLLIMLAVAFVLFDPPCVESAETHEHKEIEPALGLNERLGSKIPLDLTFRDEAGRQVKLADLIAGPTIILPVYYGCTNVCNFLQNGLAQVLPAIKPKPGVEYRVISVSFDENETPQQAARNKHMYLTSMNAPFPEDGWRFLTGDIGNIHKLTDAAGYHFKRQGRDFIHPVASFVVTGDGTIVRYLYGTTFLPKDLTLALLEAREGKIGISIRKVVDYCFTFDPANKTYVFNLLRVSATVVILGAGSFLAFLLLTGKKRKRSASDVA